MLLASFTFFFTRCWIPFAETFTTSSTLGTYIALPVMLFEGTRAAEKRKKLSNTNQTRCQQSSDAHTRNRETRQTIVSKKHSRTHHQTVAAKKGGKSSSNHGKKNHDFQPRIEASSGGSCHHWMHWSPHNHLQQTSFHFERNFYTISPARQQQQKTTRLQPIATVAVFGVFRDLLLGVVSLLRPRRRVRRQGCQRFINNDFRGTDANSLKSFEIS